MDWSSLIAQKKLVDLIAWEKEYRRNIKAERIGNIEKFAAKRGIELDDDDRAALPYRMGNRVDAPYLPITGV